MPKVDPNYLRSSELELFLFTMDGVKSRVEGLAVEPHVVRRLQHCGL